MNYIILKKIACKNYAYVCAGGENVDLLLADGWEMDLTNNTVGFESEKDAWTMFARCENGEATV